MENKELLKDMKCPECGHEDSFVITCIADFETFNHGVGNLTDKPVFDGASSCVCPECKCAGDVSSFKHRPYEVELIYQVQYPFVCYVEAVSEKHAKEIAHQRHEEARLTFKDHRIGDMRCQYLRGCAAPEGSDVPKESSDG